MDHSSRNGLHLSRRTFVRALGTAAILGGIPNVPNTPRAAAAREAVVTTGAAALTVEKFSPLAGKRVGLVTNQTGRVGNDHIVDLMTAAGVDLAAIFAPEHGFRGAAEAGAKVDDGVDPKTGAKVFSLYGATRKPTRAMLRDIDVLVFDIQDVGVRFYTYISTMGLAMQAAADRGIAFLVLDRANPLGGEDVSGFMLDPAYKSFVGQYPMPIVHGMTVGEIARMIKGERWLGGLQDLNLEVIGMRGWTRTMRWPETGLTWIPTSPNVPTFETALAYPGIGLVGETLVNEGRGTPHPFLQLGAPWIKATALAAALNDAGLPGVRFEATRYTPKSIPNVAADPRFRDKSIPGVHLAILDTATYRPLEVGMHVLAELRKMSRAAQTPLFGKLAMFHATSGTSRLHDMIERGASGEAIIASWAGEVERFRQQRKAYLIY